MKAYDEHTSQKKLAYEKAKEEHQKTQLADGGKSLFENGPAKGRSLGGSKAKVQANKIQVPKVPFEINIASIGASL